MCTVSWAVRPDGYLLVFSRDEQRIRRPASGPIERELRGVGFLAPTDGEHGGTWILVNEYGLVLGLLNHYPSRFPFDGRDRPSRGRLLMELADVADGRALIRRMTAADLSAYPPFRVLGLNRDGPVLLTWDGYGPVLRENPVTPPLISSSFRPDEVGRYRRNLFPEGNRPADLRRFHHQHDKEAPAHSVLMARDDACTHSITEIEVGTTMARMRYEPQPWIDQPGAVVEVGLSLPEGPV